MNMVNYQQQPPPPPPPPPNSYFYTPGSNSYQSTSNQPNQNLPYGIYNNSNYQHFQQPNENIVSKINYNSVHSSVTTSPTGHQAYALAPSIGNYQVGPQIQQLYLPVHQNMAPSSSSHSASSSSTATTTLQGSGQQVPPFSYVSQQNKFLPSQTFQYQYPIAHNFSPVPVMNGEVIPDNNRNLLYNSSSSSSTTLKADGNLKQNQNQSQIRFTSHSPSQPPVFSPNQEQLKNQNFQLNPRPEQQQQQQQHILSPHSQTQQKYQQFQGHLQLPPYDPSPPSHFSALPPLPQLAPQRHPQSQVQLPQITSKYPESGLHDQRLISYPGGYGYQTAAQISNNNPYGYVNKEFPQHIGMKRDYEESPLLQGEKQSSIAGVIYNSSAVFKRLKPSLSEEKSELIYKEETNRSQGRPFSSNLTGRFIFHDSLKSLLNHVDKKNNNNFAVYDMRKHHRTNEKDGSKEKLQQGNSVERDNTKLQDLVKKEEENATDKSNTRKFKRPDAGFSKEGQQITQMLFKNLKESLNNNDVVRMGIINDKLNSEVSMEALDNFLGCAHDDIMKIDRYREQFTPVQKTISYNPKCRPKQLKKDDTPTPEETSDDNTENKSKDKRFNFHTLIKENLGLDEYVFVKTIRDNNGHILKLETIKPPVDKDGKFNYTSEWLKRRICYPRYKGGMNLHLLGSSFNFILYNDIKMLLWDIKEEILSRDESDLDKILSQPDVAVDDDLKDKLFGNKIVYAQTLDR